MDAMAELTAEKGYEATKIADLVKRAGVARKTLYDNFDGKEEVFLATFDSAVTEVSTRIEAAVTAIDGDWQQQVEAALGALLEWVSERPALARLCIVEAVSATAAASRRYEETLLLCVATLRRGAPSGAGLPATTEETLVGGVAWILHQRIRRGAAGEASELWPELTDFVLSPYHGVGNLT
jgi:AcrR family transcriptional regulator